MPLGFGIFSDTGTDSDDEPAYEQIIVIELVINGRTEDLEAWICDPRCDLDEKDIYGNCGVIAAAARNDLKILNILFEAGANLDVVDHVDRFPLSYAKKHQNTKMIEYIQEKLSIFRPTSTKQINDGSLEGSADSGCRC
jgi:hypothetical protein